MLEPRRNQLVYKFFSWYINRIIKSDFEDFKFNRIAFDKDCSILLLANHFSWWDGFLLFQINRLHFKKKFHVMITEENYRKVWFLKYLGSFSVKKNSKSIIETLDYAGALLNDPQNMVLIFPQGKLFSGHLSQIKFQKGLMTLINKSKKEFQCIFAASFADYFQHRKPIMNAYLKKWESADFSNLDFINKAYNQHYEESRHKQTTIEV